MASFVIPVAFCFLLALYLGFLIAVYVYKRKSAIMRSRVQALCKQIVFVSRAYDSSLIYLGLHDKSPNAVLLILSYGVFPLGECKDQIAALSDILCRLKNDTDSLMATIDRNMLAPVDSS